MVNPSRFVRQRPYPYNPLFWQSSLSTIDMFHGCLFSGVPLSLEIVNPPPSFPPMKSQIRQEGPKFFQVPQLMYKGTFIIPSYFSIFPSYFSSMYEPTKKNFEISFPQDIPRGTSKNLELLFMYGLSDQDLGKFRLWVLGKFRALSYTWALGS